MNMPPVGPSPPARGTQLRCRGNGRAARSIPACAGNTVHGNTTSSYRYGPSPPARGTREDGDWRQQQERSIPACAGNTTRRGCAPRSRPVHPRLRGEHKVPTGSVTATLGPSPPARGTRRRRALAAPGRRSIPACAGNTKKSNASPGCTIGPSPPARGTLHLPHAAGRLARSIPACAGNTSLTVAHISAMTVHPRLRGEHLAGRSPRGRDGGPSPPARGTPAGGEHRRREFRSIPACAGNTSQPRAGASLGPVHPRLRGEHLRQRAEADPPPRSIPACAGNTPRRSQSADRPSVHPRLRGEHPPPRPCRSLISGPSPPARGTLHRLVD